MKNILVLGAGRSSASLIDYLLKNSAENNWFVSVSDASLDLAIEKINGHPSGRAITFDVNNDSLLQESVSEADIVVSLLPPSLHILAAKKCVALKTPMVTASYVSGELASLDKQAKAAGIILLNECGLDPGLDHMSAMKIIHDVKEQNEKLISFKSYCGGLVAPECNDNPWGYKFTWNPRNVVLAGQGGDAKYLESNVVQSVSYEQLFLKTEKINVSGLGELEAYANRDSLSYIQSYGLEGISSMFRGTLRMPDFCVAWGAIIKLGLTDDDKKISNSGNMTWKELMTQLAPPAKDFADYPELFSGPNSVSKKIQWLGIFSDEPVNPQARTAAQALQFLLEKKWKLSEQDKDLIVMQHEFIISRPESDTEMVFAKRKIISSLIVKGKDQIHTAMAMTVGLPLAIATKLILQGKIKSTGIVIPVLKEIYEPVLAELENLDIKFREIME